MSDKISNFFYPETLCVAGASTKEKSIGYELLKSIKVYGYKGKVFPVNPKADEILGYKCFNSIEAIKEKIDLAIVVVPKRFVETTVASLLTKGVKSIVVVTAGFRETGKEGAELEEKILSLAKKARARVVGPNCMGVINSLDSVKLNATFVAEKPETEAVGFLSQSGALGAAVINSLRETEIRFAHFISVGNKADINENDLLRFWEKDKNINVTTYYLESFVDGENFIKPFLTGKIKKPAIVLKAGRSKSGMKAASSHTGALGSKDKVVDALLKQAGIIRVDTISEMFNLVKGFENFPAPKGNRIAVITNAGGPAILAVDALQSEGLELAEFSERTLQKLNEIVPKEGAKNNPVDLLPGATADVYTEVNKTVLADKNVDAVVSIFVEPVMVAPLPVVQSVINIKSRKPIYQVVMPLPEFWSEYKKNQKPFIPLFKNPEEPAKVISGLLFHNKKLSDRKLNKKLYADLFAEYNTRQISGNGLLDNKVILSLARKYGIPIPKTKIVLPEKIKSFSGIDFPLVIKGINKSFTHKSDFGAVLVNIKNKKELQIASKEIIDSLKKKGLTADEFLIQKFVKPKFELLIGGFRDPSFGPVIMFGSGGKYVDYLDDTVIRSAFITEDEVLSMIKETVIGKLISGVRGEKGVNLKSVAGIILKSAKMLRENKNLIEFDINPLIIDENLKLSAVDIRIKVG